MLASRDALQHLDGDAALEEVVEDDESFEEVAAEAVDFLDAEHVTVAQVLDGRLESGPFFGGELAADLLFEDLEADRVEGVVLPLDVLLVATDADEAD